LENKNPKQKALLRENVVLNIHDSFIAVPKAASDNI
jgi:hypothetical protein